MKKRSRTDASKSAGSTRRPVMAYGAGHGRNLLILLVKLATVTGLGWLLMLAVPAVLHHAFGVPRPATWIAVGAAWLLGFGLTLWNFPGAREYNENV